MNGQPEPNGSDIFEMILQSSGSGYSLRPPSQQFTQPTRYNSTEPRQKLITEDWQEDHQEGQLSVDVINAEKDLVVISTMAGADSSKIEVNIHNALLTIRGVRVMPIRGAEDMSYLHQECYWGKFSRTIVLPVDVKADNARAAYKNGVLVIHIPKRKTESKVQIHIVED